MMRVKSSPMSNTAGGPQKWHLLDMYSEESQGHFSRKMIREERLDGIRFSNGSHSAGQFRIRKF